MAYKMFGQSPSSINTFLTCPRRFEGKYFLKEDPFVESEHTMYGNRFHSAAEGTIAHRKPVPTEFEFMSPVFSAVTQLKGATMVEYSVSVGPTLRESVPWRERRVGSKIDVANIHKSTARILDWKTGKSNYEEPLQLEVNAIGMFAAFPQINRILANYAYTKTGTLGGSGHGYLFLREEKYGADIEHPHKDCLENMTSRLSHTLIQIHNAHMSGSFPKQKNGLCKAHCPIRSCHFNGNFGK